MCKTDEMGWRLQVGGWMSGNEQPVAEIVSKGATCRTVQPEPGSQLADEYTWAERASWQNKKTSKKQEEIKGVVGWMMVS